MKRNRVKKSLAVSIIALFGAVGMPYAGASAQPATTAQVTAQAAQPAALPTALAHDCFRGYSYQYYWWGHITKDYWWRTYLGNNWWEHTVNITNYYWATGRTDSYHIYPHCWYLR